MLILDMLINMGNNFPHISVNNEYVYFANDLL